MAIASGCPLIRREEPEHVGGEDEGGDANADSGAKSDVADKEPNERVVLSLPANRRGQMRELSFRQRAGHDWLSSLRFAAQGFLSAKLGKSMADRPIWRCGICHMAESLAALPGKAAISLEF